MLDKEFPLGKLERIDNIFVDGTELQYEQALDKLYSFSNGIGTEKNPSEIYKGKGGKPVQRGVEFREPGLPVPCNHGKETVQEAP